MANPNIGECPCPLCAEKAFVRKQSKGASLLYLACDGCGHLAPRLPKGQDWILNRAVMYGPEGKLPPPAAAPPALAPPPAPAPAPAPPPPAKKRSAFATLLDN